ncbi:hypothetical protein D3C80_620040 [compost metagenome]
MMAPIWLDDCSMAVMALTASLTTAPEASASPRARCTTPDAWRAPSAVRFTVAVISSRAAAVSSRLAACCSVRRDRSSEAWLISLEPERMAATLATTTATACSSWAMAALKSAFSFSALGVTGAVIRWVRSPLAMALRPSPRAVMTTRSSSAALAFSASTRARSSSAASRWAAASASRPSLAMAASLKARTAAAIRPTSSLRPVAGTMTVTSPDARRRIAEVMATRGLARTLVSMTAMPAAMARASSSPPIRKARAVLDAASCFSP